MIITSKSNQLIKLVKSLEDKKYRKKYGLYVVEGTKPVNECINAGCAIVYVITTSEFEGKYQKQIVVSDQVFLWLSTEITPQGVLAVVELPTLTIQAPQDCCLLLDGIQDPGNMGSIIRTANAAGYKQLYLINCVDPYSPKSVRASMSGIFFVEIYQGKQHEILEILSGIDIICADMDGENIFNFLAPDVFCLCIGNEGNGITDKVLSFATNKISIPMRNTAESLNAGVSAAIAMYELKRNKLK